MSLGGAVSGLLGDVEAAYNNAVSNGSEPENGSATQRTLGDDLGTAIDTYYSQALVSTSVTIDAGQSDTVGGTTQVDGTGTGTGGLEDLELKNLQDNLFNAFENAAETGGSSDPIPQLAEDVSAAVHEYMTSPTVITAVVADGGQLTNAAAGTANPAGTVANPGTGKGEGIVRFESGDVSTLKSDIETAYNNAKTNGESGSSLETLALDIHTAIHLFALTAIIETQVDVFPGQNVAGYMMLVGTAAMPLPATTLLTKAASGEGELS